MGGKWNDFVEVPEKAGSEVIISSRYRRIQRLNYAFRILCRNNI
jgi:hypothetical protein